MGIRTHYLLASHISRKQSKGQCGNIVIKQLIVVKEKQIWETRKLDKANLTQSEQKPIWKQGTKKE